MQPPIEAPEEKKIEEEEERGRLTGAAIADEDELEGGVPHGRGVRESLRTRHHITRNPLLITTRTTSQQINADHPKSPNHSRSRRINDPIIQTPAASRRINRNKPTKQKTSITVERERTAPFRTEKPSRETSSDRSIGGDGGGGGGDGGGGDEAGWGGEARRGVLYGRGRVACLGWTRPTATGGFSLRSKRLLDGRRMCAWAPYPPYTCPPVGGNGSFYLTRRSRLGKRRWRLASN